MSKVRYSNVYQSHSFILNSTNTQKSNPDHIFGIRLRSHYSAGKIWLMASNSSGITFTHYWIISFTFRLQIHKSLCTKESKIICFFHYSGFNSEFFFSFTFFNIAVDHKVVDSIGTQLCGKVSKKIPWKNTQEEARKTCTAPKLLSSTCRSGQM